MRRMLRKTVMALLIGLFLLGLSAPVFAEIQAYTFTLDPFMGGYQFDNSQQLKERSYYGIRGGYNFSENLAVEAMYGFVPTETRSGVPENRDVKVQRYGLDVLYHFNPQGVWVPFVEAGVGGFQTREAGEDSLNHVIVDYGVGIKYFISDTVALRGDVKRDQFTYGKHNETNLEYTVGLTFMLGAEKKPVPVAGDTTPPFVVCTSPDRGVTGVASDRNVTATFSEDMDRRTINSSSFIVKRGTSTVSGRVNFAGTTATFIPGSELEKGTTYNATIVAGVKDASDNALANNFEWSFTTIAAPKIMPAVMISLEDSHFAFDSASLTEDGKTILNLNAKILKANPKMKILIAGYTSASGTLEYNQKLSERRATAVKNYLVSEGVASDRLDKVGYGARRPAEYEPVPSDIYSEAAKANMRVLFEVIVK